MQETYSKIPSKVKYNNCICPNAKLLIVGDGPSADELKDLTLKLNLENNVIFAGKVMLDEVKYYYQISDMFVTASRSETQGLTVIEAMAAGIPPLCIDDESFRGTVTDELNGRVFKNQEEYVNQVTEFYENKKMIDTYSKQARVQAEHCSSRSYALSVLEVYQRALKEKKEKTGLFTKIANFFKGE